MSLELQFLCTAEFLVGLILKCINKNMQEQEECMEITEPRLGHDKHVIWGIKQTWV